MEVSNECFYCRKNEQLQSLMIEIMQLSISTLYLFKEQTYLGRCVVALNGHKTEFFQLTKEERMQFMEDVSVAAAAINKAFSPNKINYAVFGDLVPHLHFHIVPKYINGQNWGKSFCAGDEKSKYLKPEEYQKISDVIRSNV